MNSRWTSSNPREFVKGDIICNRKDQSGLRLVVRAYDVAIWTTGLVHCALTENNDEHPIFPIYFEHIDNGFVDPLLRLGNIEDYSRFVERIQDEVTKTIESIKDYNEENDGKGENV